MKRLIAVLCAVVVGLSGSLIIGVTPASASYPVDRFGPVLTAANSGYTDGTITWYNRSVEIQGVVVDYSGGLAYAQVQFRFYHYGTLLDIETRTAEFGQRLSFHWTEPGPVGGITAVQVDLCDPQNGCAVATVYCRASTGC